MNDLGAFARKYLFAALSCLYLFTIGVFLSRHRPLISRICSFFHYPRRSPIPEIDIREAAPEDLAVEIRETLGVNGNVSLLETLVLCRLVRKFKPAAIFEIGTFNGRTTLNLAVNAPAGAAIHTLDLPKGQIHSHQLPLAPIEKMFVDKDRVGELFKDSPQASKITSLQGDSATFDFRPYEGRMDFVFIDGSHSREYVLNDTREALRLIGARSGVVLWHDYGTEGWEGVIAALDQLYREGGVFLGLRRIRNTTLVMLQIAGAAAGAG